MSATTPDVPLHPHTDRWVFRSGGESGRVSRAERRGVYGDDEARRACADAGEKPDRPWHRTTSSSRILTLRSRRVKAFLSLGNLRMTPPRGSSMTTWHYRCGPELLTGKGAAIRMRRHTHDVGAQNYKRWRITAGGSGLSRSGASARVCRRATRAGISTVSKRPWLLDEAAWGRKRRS